MISVIVHANALRVSHREVHADRRSVCLAQVFESATAEPAARATTRLRLEALDGRPAGVVSQLSAMTVQHGGRDLYEAKRRVLGQVVATLSLVYTPAGTSEKVGGLLNRTRCGRTPTLSYFGRRSRRAIRTSGSC